MNIYNEVTKILSNILLNQDDEDIESLESLFKCEKLIKVRKRINYQSKDRIFKVLLLWKGEFDLHFILNKNKFVIEFINHSDIWIMAGTLKKICRELNISEEQLERWVYKHV